ncbi:hypothetical protein PVAND_004207 [Polypedilum vanderplanki]|uniref:SET domain-containing protein n=1 Tax=Polypedilum vanderplanki TaxID=319348 RepID=A0A9J6BXF6_POLVA|nr:hypothetical protein PVAND_004207 [Polypedilum vanderplanki]
MLPFTIEKNSQFGRFAVATHNIEAGSFLFDEIPFAIGPNIRTYCCCLECYCPVDGTASGTRCENCSWPLCNECSKLSEFSAHKRECEIFREAKCKFFNLPDANATCMQLDCITPLRVLLEREINMERWKNEVEPMEDHREKRINSNAWKEDQQNIVGYLLGPCKLGQRGITAELIHKVIGVLEVNAFEAKTLKGTFVRCLYPRLAILSHSCTPNTTHAIHPSDNYSLKVRATVAIEKGSQLFSCYTYTQKGTLDRQQHLMEGKYFQCHCERCLDPTELGTHFSSMKCSSCLFGDVLSSNPLDSDANWICNKCSQENSAESIKEMLKALQGEIDNANSIEFLENSLEEYEHLLNPNHYIMTSMKNSLIDAYGHINGYMLHEMPDILLKRKIELCDELLAILDVFERGMTRARAMILYELHTPIVLYAKSQFEIGNSTKLKYLKQLENAREILNESREILEWEDENVCMIIWGARKSQENLEKLIASLKCE